VVLYHVGVPGISGGYVGVDVFFVISGFLIISQIMDGLKRGTFSFGEFWSRRALRILPPYLLVLALSVAAAPFVLSMPDELKEFGKEVGHAAVMAVNHLFLIQEGYFDTAADTKVLLHLWSLAVEEQFYLVAPILLAALWRLPKRLGLLDLRPRIVVWTTIAIFAASLAGCILLTAGGRNYAFYLSALRAWEFVAGGAVGALIPLASRWTAKTNAALAAAGLAAIVIAAVTFTVDTPYPSWRAALPVFGAAAVITGGLAYPTSPAIRLLATRPMVGIGLVSYAWYLWHWPLLAFARILQFGERNFIVDGGLALLSLALATATYLLVERPIRRWREQRGKPLGWRPVFAGAAVCVAIAAGGKLSFDAAAKRLAETLPAKYVPALLPAAPFCDLRSDKPEHCIARAAGKRIALVVGDSQAMAAHNGLARFTDANGAFTVMSASGGCPPMIGLNAFAEDEERSADCAQLRKRVLALLGERRIKPDYAILFGRWALYGADDDYLLGPLGADRPAPDQAGIFAAGMRQTIADLKALGVRRMLVIGPTPLFPRPAPNCLYLADRYGLDRGGTCGTERPRAEAEARVARERLAAALAGIEEVRYVDPFDIFCNTERCLPFVDDTILFRDTNHLTDLGTQRIIDAYRADFGWLMGASETPPGG
jgi:peptidoglycan/LPS O-acetylase OafA/YrhL